MPAILILDEPTADLDPEERVRFRSLITRFSRERIVILSTHIVSDVERIAEKVIMMKALMQYELKKIFSRGLTQVILLVLISVSIFLSVSTYQNKYAFDGVSNEGSGRTAVQIDKKIASKYEGILTNEKVREMMSDFAPLVYIEGGIPYNITMGTLLLYQAMLAFTAAVSVTGITLFCSAAAKKQITALSASAAFYLFPMLAPVSETSPAFRIIGLLPIYQGQFTSLMSVSQMNNRLLYAIMAVPAALVLFAAGAIFSRRFFAGHEVSA